MPLYDLECKKCRYEFEGFAPVIEKDLIICPIEYCGGIGKTLITCKSKAHYYDEYDKEAGAFMTGPAQREKVLRSKNLVETTKYDSSTTHEATKKHDKKKKENDSFLSWANSSEY